MSDIKIFNDHQTHRIHRKSMIGLIRNVLQEEKVQARELSIVFVDNKYIKKLNKRYLNHNALTDVMAFRLGGTQQIEGEVYVNLDRAKSQAKDYGVSFANEVGRLVVHGILHLVGYEDRTQAQRRSMKKKEDRYLQQLRSI